MPDSVKNKAMTVQQVNDDKLLIKEIVSWVYAKDCTAVSTAASTPVQTATAETVSKSAYDAIVAEKAALAAQVAALIVERSGYKTRAEVAEGKLAKIKQLSE